MDFFNWIKNIQLNKEFKDTNFNNHIHFFLFQTQLFSPILTPVPSIFCWFRCKSGFWKWSHCKSHARTEFQFPHKIYTRISTPSLHFLLHSSTQSFLQLLNISGTPTSMIHLCPFFTWSKFIAFRFQRHWLGTVWLYFSQQNHLVSI